MGNSTFVVAQTTYDRLRNIRLQADQEGGSDGAFAHSEGNRLSYVTAAAETRAQYAQFLGTLCDAVKADCLISPCPAASELEPKRREELVEVMGRHNLDSVLLGAQAGAAVWTDDMFLGLIGRMDFTAPRVWTQAVLFVLRQEGALSQGEYDQAVARLVGWHYQGVLWNAETMVAAAEVADWRMDRWPASEVVRCLGEDAVGAGDRLEAAVGAIRAAWRMEVPLQHKQALVFAVLGGLGSLRLARRLYQLVPKRFSVDVFSADDVCACIAYWLNNPVALVRS